MKVLNRSILVIAKVCLFNLSVIIFLLQKILKFLYIFINYCMFLPTITKNLTSVSKFAKTILFILNFMLLIVLSNLG